MGSPDRIGGVPHLRLGELDFFTQVSEANAQRADENSDSVSAEPQQEEFDLGLAPIEESPLPSASHKSSQPISIPKSRSEMPTFIGSRIYSPPKQNSHLRESSVERKEGGSLLKELEKNKTPEKIPELAIGKHTFSRIERKLKRLSTDFSPEEVPKFTLPNRSRSDGGGATHNVKPQRIIKAMNTGVNPLSIPEHRKLESRSESAKLPKIPDPQPPSATETTPKGKERGDRIGFFRGLFGSPRSGDVKEDAQKKVESPREGVSPKSRDTKKLEALALQTKEKPQVKFIHRSSFNLSICAELTRFVDDYHKIDKLMYRKVSKEGVQDLIDDVVEGALKTHTLNTQADPIVLERDILEALRSREGLLRNIIPLFTTLLEIVRKLTQEQSTDFTNVLINYLENMVNQRLDKNHLHVFMTNFSLACKYDDKIKDIFKYALSIDKLARDQYIRELRFWGSSSNLNEISATLTTIINKVRTQPEQDRKFIRSLEDKPIVIKWDEKLFQEKGSKFSVESIQQRSLLRCVEPNIVHFTHFSVISKQAGKDHRYESSTHYPITFDDVNGKTITERAYQFYSKVIANIYKAGFNRSVDKADQEKFLNIITLFNDLDGHSEAITFNLITKILPLFVDTHNDNASLKLIKGLVEGLKMDPLPPTMNEKDALVLLLSLIIKSQSKSEDDYFDLVTQYCHAIEKFEKKQESSLVQIQKGLKLFYSLLPLFSTLYKLNDSQLHHQLKTVSATVQNKNFPKDEFIHQDFVPFVLLLLENQCESFTPTSLKNYADRLNLCSPLSSEIIFQMKWKPLLELLLKTTINCMGICEQGVLRPALADLYKAPTFMTRSPEIYCVKIIIYPHGQVKSEVKWSSHDNPDKQIFYRIIQRELMQVNPTETRETNEPFKANKKDHPLMHIPLEWNIWSYENDTNHYAEMRIRNYLFRKNRVVQYPLQFLTEADTFRYDDGLKVRWKTIIQERLRNPKDPLEALPQLSRKPSEKKITPRTVE